MQILIPMVGAGQRFVDAGYATPKPLLEVDGVPMVVRVVQDMPAADKVIFVINGEHVRAHAIDRVLRRYFPKCELVVAPKLTAGQACSVRLGLDAADPDDDVLVAACDNTHLFNPAAWQKATDASDTQAIIWAYRREPRVLVRPQWYGWVECGEGRRARRVSVKRPISDDPLNDFVVSGSFWFRSAGSLATWIDRLVERNERVNNEFYLDSVPNLLIEAGEAVDVFEVDKYIGWGTPADYEDYHRWSDYVHSRRLPAAG